MVDFLFLNTASGPIRSQYKRTWSDNLQLPYTSKLEVYMESDKLQQACVQPPTSLQIRPLTFLAGHLGRHLATTYGAIMISMFILVVMAINVVMAIMVAMVITVAMVTMVAIVNWLS